MSTGGRPVRIRVLELDSDGGSFLRADMRHGRECNQGRAARRRSDPQMGARAGTASPVSNRDESRQARDRPRPKLAIGRDALVRLATKATSSSRTSGPRSCARLGWIIRRCRPSTPLIYPSISGYGQNGRDRAKADSISSRKARRVDVGDSEPAPPVKVGVPVTDLGPGSLRRRDPRGVCTIAQLRRGQYRHVLLEAGLALSRGGPSSSRARRAGSHGLCASIPAPYQRYGARTGTHDRRRTDDSSRLANLLGHPDGAAWLNSRIRPSAC